MVFRPWNLIKQCKLALKKSHDTILSHCLPWKYRTISDFLTHPIRWPAFEGFHLQFTHITVYLLRDATLLLRNSTYNLKLYLNKVYLRLRDAKVLLRDSVYKLKINNSFWVRDTNLLLIPYTLIIERFLMFKEQKSLK